MNLLILYANFEDKPVTLTIGEVIAEANVCSLGTKVKQKINSVTKQVNPDRAKKLWSKLKLEHNKFTSSDSMLRTELFFLINENHDVFTSDQCKVGDTSWVKFKKRVHPLPFIVQVACTEK